MQTIQKSYWYDNLRAIATIGVIFIHVSSDYAPETGSIPAYQFWIGNFFDSLSRFSVPVFVMLSGALLLPREYELKVFLKKRFSRLLIPFLFWSLMYTLYSFYCGAQEGAHLSWMEMARETFVQFRDGSSIHLWYIYMILGLYLFVPIIGKWARVAKETELLYFLGIWLAVMVLDQPVLSKLKPDIELSYFTGFLGYLVLGFYLSKKDFGQRQTLIGLGMIFTGLLATIFGTFFVLKATNHYVSTFYECLSPNILLYSAGLVVLFRNRDVRNKTLVWARDFISKYSLGIYLVHVLVLRSLDDWEIRWDFIHPAFGIPFTAFVCLIISGLIIFTLNKIPYVRQIAG